MDRVRSNFGNRNFKIELEVKVSLMEKESFQLRRQLFDKLLIIKQLRTNSKINSFPSYVSTTINPITTHTNLNQ